jgi:hypothetical protein
MLVVSTTKRALRRLIVLSGVMEFGGALLIDDASRFFTQKNRGA